mmetsp:Transcript_44631/g.106701  ORF Transcript_44631/g.106701 Transcript_44631/m.106701 type:complete len:263 (+) Transcript_44631:1112-1900(+)
MRRPVTGCSGEVAEIPFARYICWLAPSGWAQPAAPKGGSELKTTEKLPLWEKILGSSGPVTTFRMRVLLLSMYLSLTQRSDQAPPAGVRSPVQSDTAIEGAEANVVSKAPRPRVISELYTSSMMVTTLPLYVPRYSRYSSLCLRAATISSPPSTKSAVFMSTPPSSSAGESSSRRSFMPLAGSTLAGSCVTVALLLCATSPSGSALKPPRMMQSSRGTAGRAYGHRFQAYWAGSCTTICMSTAVATRKIRNVKKMWSPVGQR